MKKFICYYFAVILYCLLSHQIYAQNDSISGITYIQKLISENALDEAKTELKTQLELYHSVKNTDSLIKYVFLVGSLKLANGDYNIAIKSAEAFGKELERYKSPFVNKEVLLEIAWIYDDAGQSKRSYQIVEDALQIAQNIKDPKKAGLSVIYHNLGYIASNLGDYSLAKKQYAKAIKAMNLEPEINYESLHKTYNALGGMMWYSAKMDSSLYYFNKAHKMLDSVKKTPINAYYRPALVKMNIAVITHSLGRIDEAIEASKDVISGFQKYLDISKDESRKLRALKHQLSAIDNLGSFYHSIGEFKRADDLITYSYLRKLKTLAPDDHNIIISQIISAQAKMGLRDFEAANKIIDQSLNRIKNSKNTQFFWHASALSTKATICDEIGDYANAEKYFEVADSLYRRSLGRNSYTRDYLDEIIDMTQFYAKTNNSKKAISLAEESYHFIKSSDFKNTLQGFHHILNLAEVHYKLKNYDQALTYSNEALNFLQNTNFNASNFKDSIQIQYRKPKALLVNTKSKYFLNNNRSISFLKDLLNQLEQSIDILEQRKSIIKSYDDLSLLISENIDAFNFLKKLNLEIYTLNKDSKYLFKTIELHESSLYNRIRSRLNLRNNMSFSNIPQATLNHEEKLKNDISKALNDAKNIESYIDASTNWSVFLDSLKQNYPKYYQMRYATIEESLANIKESIPKNTTIVRYLYIDKLLYAFVIDSSKSTIFELNAENLNEHINQLGEHQSSIKKVSTQLHNLYKQLWEPFDSYIDTENIIIIPDRELFNLSFETLTSSKIDSFIALSEKGLLAKYNIAYNFSLFLLENNKTNINYNQNFIAFAPEFNATMKANYEMNITDSLSLDKTYLTLLPQPFSAELAKKYSKRLNGQSFLNQKASKQIFTQEAKEHKIIHIGTHAESNNISPELSRLIFAKDVSGEDNSLYTYEIYNQNLSSKLAILTACETGKPSYQAGEGMISLAHAFNYAGSESILTSLWKIDEQSSAKILELFYGNILKGWSSDKALKHAKLDYLKTAKGRTKHPQYWAGLVLIGDASPINIQTSSNILYWFFGGLLLVLLLLFIKKRLSK